MAISSLEQTIADIRTELKISEDGKGFATIRAVARLAGVDHRGLLKAFQCGDLKPSKLAEKLMAAGFEGGDLKDFSEQGIPDTAIAVILEYYALDAGRYCTQSAKQAYKAFAGVGIRSWMHQLTGWEKKEDIQPKSAIDILVESVMLIKEHSGRLDGIEYQNRLLVEENALLKSQVKLLQATQEVIELETAANAAELTRYKNGHGRWYTISAWCNLHGYSLSLKQATLQGRKAAALCRAKDIAIQTVADTRYGTVNCYPDSVLMELVWE